MSDTTVVDIAMTEAQRRLLNVMHEMRHSAVASSSVRRSEVVWYVGRQEYQMLVALAHSFSDELRFQDEFMGYRVLRVNEESHLNLARVSRG